jgi:hypothetical protein
VAPKETTVNRAFYTTVEPVKLCSITEQKQRYRQFEGSLAMFFLNSLHMVGYKLLLEVNYFVCGICTSVMEDESAQGLSTRLGQ